MAGDRQNSHHGRLFTKEGGQHGKLVPRLYAAAQDTKRLAISDFAIRYWGVLKNTFPLGVGCAYVIEL